MYNSVERRASEFCGFVNWIYIYFILILYICDGRLFSMHLNHIFFYVKPKVHFDELKQILILWLIWRVRLSVVHKFDLLDNLPLTTSSIAPVWRAVLTPSPPTTPVMTPGITGNVTTVTRGSHFAISSRSCRWLLPLPGNLNIRNLLAAIFTSLLDWGEAWTSVWAPRWGCH